MALHLAPWEEKERHVRDAERGSRNVTMRSRGVRTVPHLEQVSSEPFTASWHDLINGIRMCPTGARDSGKIPSRLCPLARTACSCFRKDN